MLTPRVHRRLEKALAQVLIRGAYKKVSIITQKYHVLFFLTQ